jgi:hypothetical protein
MPSRPERGGGTAPIPLRRARPPKRWAVVGSTRPDPIRPGLGTAWRQKAAFWARKARRWGRGGGVAAAR